MCVERDDVLQHAIPVLYGIPWFYICEVSLLHCGMIFTILHGMLRVGTFGLVKPGHMHV